MDSKYYPFNLFIVFLLASEWLKMKRDSIFFIIIILNTYTNACVTLKHCVKALFRSVCLAFDYLIDGEIVEIDNIVN